MSGKGWEELLAVIGLSMWRSGGRREERIIKCGKRYFKGGGVICMAVTSKKPVKRVASKKRSGGKPSASAEPMKG